MVTKEAGRKSARSLRPEKEKKNKKRTWKSNYTARSVPNKVGKISITIQPSANFPNIFFTINIVPGYINIKIYHSLFHLRLKWWLHFLIFYFKVAGCILYTIFRWLHHLLLLLLIKLVSYLSRCNLFIDLSPSFIYS